MQPYNQQQYWNANVRPPAEQKQPLAQQPPYYHGGDQQQYWNANMWPPAQQQLAHHPSPSHHQFAQYPPPPYYGGGSQQNSNMLPPAQPLGHYPPSHQQSAQYPPPPRQPYYYGDGAAGTADVVRSKTLYIGSLEDKMDEAHLNSCFEHTEQLGSAKIIRNKQTGQSEGYGFLKFRSRAAAENIMQHFNGKPMPNASQSFNLNWASRNAETFDIFVENLGYVLLETFKSEYPSVKSAQVIRDRVTGNSKGCGFVRFGDETETSRSIVQMNGLHISNMPIRIEHPSDETPSSAQPQNASHQNPQGASDLTNTSVPTLIWSLVCTSKTSSLTKVDPLSPLMSNDIALEILLRIPIKYHDSQMRVSKSWATLFTNLGRFFNLRKLYGIKAPFVSIFSYNQRMAKAELIIVDITEPSWRSIAVPEDIVYAMPDSYTSASIPEEGALFLMVGYEGRCTEDFINVFVKYDLRVDVWTRIEEIHSLHPIKPLEAVNKMIYATSGFQQTRDDDIIRVFDPEIHVWHEVNTPTRHRAPHEATVFDNQLLFSYVSHDRGGAYDPRCDTWQELGQVFSDGLLTGDRFQMLGRLFVVEYTGTPTLRVYNDMNQTWDPVEGQVMPVGHFIRPLHVAPHQNKVLVVKQDFSIAIGTISCITEDNADSSSSFRVDRWEVVEVPENFGYLIAYDAKLLFA